MRRFPEYYDVEARNDRGVFELPFTHFLARVSMQNVGFTVVRSLLTKPMARLTHHEHHLGSNYEKRGSLTFKAQRMADLLWDRLVASQIIDDVDEGAACTARVACPEPGPLECSSAAAIYVPLMGEHTIAVRRAWWQYPPEAVTVGAGDALVISPAAAPMLLESLRGVTATEGSTTLIVRSENKPMMKGL